VTVPYGAAASASSRERLQALIEARRGLFEAAAVALAGAVFLASVLPNLANHPTLTDDEAWVMSASYKLAREGVFGSDMFRGFFHADTRYYFNMPLHHFVVAAAFKLLGAGVLQARLVGVAYGLATIVLTYLFARRLYGGWTAVLALGLLLFLRLNMGFDTGLPLQELAANVRYDLAPVPFMLAGFLLLLRPPSAWRAAAAGVLFGIATLMQFYGAFAVPVAVAFLALDSGPLRQRLRRTAVLAGAAVLVLLPYGAFALAHFDDFRGQVSTVGQRDDFLDPRFYLDNLAHEPDRFLRPLGFKEVPRGEDPRTVSPRLLSAREMLTRRPSAKVAVLVGLPLAAGFAAWRARRRQSRGDRLLALALAGLCLQYALFDSLKLYIYWVPVVPLLCTGIAGVAAWLLTAALRRDGPILGPAIERRLALVLAAGCVLCLLGFFAEGAQARVSGFQAASRETEYAGLGDLIHRDVPAGATVVGSTSLWWALRDTDYHSYFMLFYVTSPDAGPHRSTIPDYLSGTGARYLVLTRLGQEELDKHLSPADKRDLEAYKAAHGTLVRRIDGAQARSYGYVEVWRFD
jgi:4-amino-4-deoxy-L-arabinose transferase-like glycosyltransferase